MGESRAAQVVAFALFFTNFSHLPGQPGLYLEDLYVQPAHRGTGLGKALLQHLGALAVERGCGRFEWSVLDWNENAIRFYEKMGATVMPDWRICRVAGDALQAFAAATESAREGARPQAARAIEQPLQRHAHVARCARRPRPTTAWRAVGGVAAHAARAAARRARSVRQATTGAVMRGAARHHHGQFARRQPHVAARRVDAEFLHQRRRHRVAGVLHEHLAAGHVGGQCVARAARRELGGVDVGAPRQRGQLADVGAAAGVAAAVLHLVVAAARRAASRASFTPASSSMRTLRIGCVRSADALLVAGRRALARQLALQLQHRQVHRQRDLEHAFGLRRRPSPAAWRPGSW